METRMPNNCRHHSGQINLTNDIQNSQNFVGIFEPMEYGKYGHLLKFSGDKQFDIANPYVEGGLIRQYHLKKGQKISAKILPRTDFPNPKVLSIELIDDLPPTERNNCPSFEKLTIVHPHKQIILEHNGGSLSSRMIDMFCPIAKGQRAIIVSPPRSGKTTLLHEISKSIAINCPEVAIIVALIDERPEEVTDFRRSVDAEIYASSNDQGAKNHIRAAQLAVERAKNLVETGKDTILLIDSITRLARAFNTVNSSGRTMTGGLDARAMEMPRNIFATARDTENNGSLTIIATALIETGSKMDDLIFQEMKGTGNMEIVLNRKLAEMRIWPAIDLQASGTRHEELILGTQMLNSVNFLRRAFANIETEKATESLVNRLSQHPTNLAFLSAISKSTKL